MTTLTQRLERAVNDKGLSIGDAWNLLSEALEYIERLEAEAQAVIDRWDTPLWKDVPATAGYIARLRAALSAQRGGE